MKQSKLTRKEKALAETVALLVMREKYPYQNHPTLGQYWWWCFCRLQVRCFQNASFE